MERLRLESITKAYNGQNVVHDIDLSVNAGEFCVVLGPSGSGKTTIMNLIAGFTAPSAGDIRVDGRSITGLAPHHRNIGMMFQGYGLFPHMSVFENVAFPLQARGVAKAEMRRRVGQMLEIVELAALSGRRPDQLSGGQQQRTALARALVFEPRLLLMDEPLAALDRRLRERMQMEIRALQRRLAITVLFITHDQEEAMSLADRLVVMKNGQIEQIGSPLEVYWRPRTRFVCDFLGDSNLFPVRVKACAEGIAECETPAGTTVHVSAAESPSVGIDAFVAIRPERTRFTRTAGPTDNILRGSIAEVADVGTLRRYRIGLEGSDTHVLISEPGTPTPTGRAVGEEVLIAFDRQDAVLVFR